jgi:hypothetical protein
VRRGSFMAKVLLEMSMSLDGYVAGPDVSGGGVYGARRRASARMDVRGPVGGRGRALRDRSLSALLPVEKRAHT